MSMVELTIQDHINRGWIQCPFCDAHRNVDEHANVSACDKCGDAPLFWNLLVTLD